MDDTNGWRLTGANRKTQALVTPYDSSFLLSLISIASGRISSLGQIHNLAAFPILNPVCRLLLVTEGEGRKALYWLDRLAGRRSDNAHHI